MVGSENLRKPAKTCGKLGRGGQNDSRFGVPTSRRGEKSGFTGLPPWRAGKTTAVWGNRRLVRVIKALLPPSRRRVRVKRQSFRGVAASAGIK
jgi:hypothetical protein